MSTFDKIPSNTFETQIKEKIERKVKTVQKPKTIKLDTELTSDLIEVFLPTPILLSSVDQ